MSSDPLTERVTLLAPAKLTLSLAVTGVRDDGMHLIDAEMVTVDLSDTLTLRPTSQTSSVDVTYRAPATEPLTPIDPTDNLVTRALAMVGVRADVELVKRIGVGAGLGGGSADAAAILRWANETERAEGPVTPVAAMALGSDVAFCLVGGRARVTGAGEHVEVLAAAHEEFTVLVPPFVISTQQVYEAWDRLQPDGHPHNDLQPAALAVAPELAAWRDALGDQTGETPQLAGSGGAFFVRGTFPDVTHEGVDAVTVSTTGPTGGSWSASWRAAS